MGFLMIFPKQMKNDKTSRVSGLDINPYPNDQTDHRDLKRGIGLGVPRVLYTVACMM